MDDIMKGLEILYKYNDPNISAGHDQIWVGSDFKEKDEYLFQHIKQLEELGWFFDYEYECWTHFC